MLKKILSVSLLVLIGIVLTGCQETIILEATQTNYTIMETAEVPINLTTNDEKGFDVVSSNTAIVEVRDGTSSSLVITGISEGIATITITSKTDASIVVEITVTVRRDISISYGETTIDLYENDVFAVEVTSNDDALEYSSSNTTVFVVDDSGVITAKEEGDASLIISSTYDENVELSITIRVAKEISLTPEYENYVMVVGDTKSVNVTGNDTFTFESRNPDIVAINESGELEALKFGVATIRVISDAKPEVYEEFTVTVFKFTEDIIITGSNLLFVGMDGQLAIDPSPIGAYDVVTWTSSNTDIITVDEFGVVTGIGVGTASAIATSVLDDEVVDTYDIEVINVLLVDGTKTTGDTYIYEGVELTHGEKLFTTIADAILNATPNTKILIANGTYTEDVDVSMVGLVLEGIDNATYGGTMTISAENVIIKNLIFTGEAEVTNTVDIANLIIDGNSTNALTRTSGYLINLTGVTGVQITNNNFTGLQNSAVRIDDFVGGLILIKDNIIDGAIDAVTITADREYDITTEINILWNDINAVDAGFIIDLLYGTEDKQIEVYARFNSIVYTAFGAKSYVDNEIDFTLNYWGSETLDMADFENITSDLVRGNYTTSEAIITEDDYDPRIPVIIEIVNPIAEIMIGETHTFEFSVLPMDIVDPLIRFITSSPTVLAVNQSGVLTPLVSGVATITLRSGYDSSKKTTIEINIITTPGVELSTDHILNDLIVGDTFKLTATPFPVGSAGEAVTFVSDDTAVATIDSSGNVTTLSEGLVTMKASLTSDPLVYAEYTFYVYTALDENNLLDYLTMNQVSYSTPHEWTAFGFQYNYFDKRYESVSRYYFDDIPVNTSKLLPLGYSIRPGLMSALPVGITQYNPDNIHWVVIHDTASTATGSNALAHANWLYNSPGSVSWHYSIDSEYIYQHLPENERGYHAGDGSNLVGEGSLLGGGNRNGVGIEMAINDDGDMMRTWQRTAKLTADILVRNGLPLSQARYHNDFSGKDCPNTLRNSGLIPLFEIFKQVEFKVLSEHGGATITFTSNNPDYLDNTGRVIQMPDRSMTVSYTITVVENGITESRTFYTYLPGTVH